MEEDRHTAEAAFAPSSIVPRPRPGYESPKELPDATDAFTTEALTTYDRLRVVAACARAAAGVLFCVMALLYLPPQMFTPVMSGVGLVMVVNGALGIWKAGREAPRLKPLTKVLVWVFPALSGVVVAVALVFGPVLGPDWDAMRARSEPATFQPAGVPR